MKRGRGYKCASYTLVLLFKLSSSLNEIIEKNDFIIEFVVLISTFASFLHLSIRSRFIVTADH